MWSFKPMRRYALFAALLAVPALSACSSFQPVYSSQAGQMAEPTIIELAFAKPAGRLEQIVQQELALRFPTTTNPQAPLATISVQTIGGQSFLTASGGVLGQVKTGVTATITIKPRDGTKTEPFKITRSADTSYTTSGQVLADRAAANEALERAAKAAAESLRLALLGVLVR